MKKETVSGVVLSSSCIISFSGTFLKFAWVSAEKVVGGDSLPDGADRDPEAKRPTGRPCHQPPRRGHTAPAPPVTEAWPRGSGGDKQMECWRKGWARPFTVRVVGSLMTGVLRPPQKQNQRQKSTKSGPQSRQQSECQGLKTENGQEPDPDNTSLK